MAKKRTNKKKSYIQHAPRKPIPIFNGRTAAMGPARENGGVTREQRMYIQALRQTNFNIIIAVAKHIQAGMPIPHNLCFNIVKCNHEFFKFMRAPRYGLCNMAVNGVVYPATFRRSDI